MTQWDFDLSALHGPQGMTDEDRAYSGSTYSEVREALYANPYRDGQSGEVPGPLPMFKSTIRNAWAGTLPHTGPNQLELATARSVDSRADLRWGPDRKGFRRILAPNGICILGTWKITEDNPYTGYFQNGSNGLFIGRYSTDGSGTRRGQRRSLSLAGKIYPTMDPNHETPLMPASLISQEDLGGMPTDFINDAELRNEPNVTIHRRRLYALVMFRAGMLFSRKDKEPEIRQIYEIAELGKPEGEPTISPRHMLLKMADGQTRVEGDRLDFRDEIYAHIFKQGNPDTTGTIVFDISVSNTGRRKGFPGYRRVEVNDWLRIGQVTITEAICSYNADHVVQFRHPGWRNDRNDSSTSIRSGEERVLK